MEMSDLFGMRLLSNILFVVTCGTHRGSKWRGSKRRLSR